MNHQNSKRKPSKAGLVVLIILLLFIGIPAFLIMMLQPGPSRWERINSESGDVVVREIEVNSSSIFIHENWIERRLEEGISLINEESPDFQIAGLDLSMERDRMTILAGATLPHPLSPENKTIKAALEASLSASMTDTRELKLQIESLKLGRLPVPVKLLTRIQALKSSLNTENLLKGREAEFDLETLSLTVRLDDMMDEISPGSHIQDLRILEERLSLSLSLSPVLRAEIQKIASQLEDIVPHVHDSIMENLDGGKADVLEEATELFTKLAVQEEKEAKATLSYLEGEVRSSFLGEETLLDFGALLEEGTTVTTAKKSFAEIILPGLSVLKILEESQVILHSARQTDQIEENRLELTGGKIRAVVASLDREEDQFSVEAGMTTMGVRGTDFVIEFDGRVELTVLEGSVAIENGAGMALLSENQRVDADENQAPEPVTLKAADREKLLEETRLLTDQTVIDGLMSYNAAPALLKLFTIYADFYLSLTPAEQEELEVIVNESVEEHPELMRQIVEFAEEQGWMDEYELSP